MARIMACADAFDAMTSDRPYRKCRMTIKEALLEIKDNSGTQFDPKVARVFIRIIRKM
jgi:HD-GYP domain-containing protein (c-di-GMP phosphodiesterase class II)